MTNNSVRAYPRETQEMVFVGKDRRYIVASSSRWAARWHRTGRRARSRTMSDRWDAEQSEFTVGPAILVASPLPVLTFRHPTPP